MMLGSLPLLLLALTPALSAPPPYDEYSQVLVPQKRAALVLDRLLIALQKALREDASRASGDDPRMAPLRIGGVDEAGMMGDAGDDVSVLGLHEVEEPRFAPLRVPAIVDDTSSLQRRGQGAGRGRVLRCYFNAVTCF